MTKTFYAIRNKKTDVLLSISCSAEEDFSICKFKDDRYDDVPWLTDNEDFAKSAITVCIEWYNSILEQPENSWMFKDGKFQNYEVVEITLTIN